PFLIPDSHNSIARSRPITRWRRLKVSCPSPTTPVSALTAPITGSASTPRSRLHARIAEGLAATAPDRYITTATLEGRPGRLFIDYLRNGRGTTAVGSRATDLPLVGAIGCCRLT